MNEFFLAGFAQFRDWATIADTNAPYDLMLPMPDQFPVLVHLLDAVKGNLMNCPIRADSAEEKMVARGNMNVI